MLIRQRALQLWTLLFQEFELACVAATNLIGPETAGVPFQVLFLHLLHLARVITVQAIMRGADFVETFHILHEDHGFDAKQAFTITMRVYRGGGLTKDAIYLNGLVRVLKWLEDGNELEPLLIGKIREDNVPLINELIYRRMLHPAPLRPRYLDYPGVRSKLDQLKTGSNVLDLLQK